jgi:DeoR/GlpR family transcriptional regulator of sugar metabolism
MNPKARQSQILDLVRQHGRASVEELASRFSASRETIRRDLNVLSKAGIILKVHGAAKLPHAQGEGPFEQRMTEHASAKREIARRAAPLVGPGDTVFIDTGSTTLFYAEAIAKTDGLTVVTNSTEIARIIGRTVICVSLIARVLCTRRPRLDCTEAFTPGLGSIFLPYAASPAVAPCAAIRLAKSRRYVF